MTIYQSIAGIGPRVMSKRTLFKYGFNLSPMYRRSTGRIVSVTDDLSKISVHVPISYRNRETVYCEVEKTIYVAQKAFYKEKQQALQRRTVTSD